MNNLPATSYVAAIFHPTIGQRAHKSLSNTATPELGMITQGIRVKEGLHKQPSQHSWVFQAVKELEKAKCKDGGLNGELRTPTPELT